MTIPFGKFFRPRLTAKTILYHSLILLRVIACAALILAIARPQFISQEKSIQSEGIDVMIVLDISGSMESKDFHPSRLDAAKLQAAKFVSARPNDRIGLIEFASHAFLACPITIDHDALKNVISQASVGTLSDGTAIGLGLGSAVNHLQGSSSSKIVILMTDGENNMGSIDPMVAAEMAKNSGIRVFTIGMEPLGQKATPMESGDTIPSMQSGELLLKQIAAVTGGEYFHASDEHHLAEIYSQLDTLVKTKADVTTFSRYTEHFFLFAAIALLALIVEILLRYTIFKTIP